MESIQFDQDRRSPSKYEKTNEKVGFLCLRLDFVPRGHFPFHENKAYVFLWQKATHENMPIVELDFGKAAKFYHLQVKIETRSSKLIFVPDIRKDCLFTQCCPQLVDGRIFFLLCPTNRQQNGPVKLQFWACDLSIFIASIIIVDDNK